ncbi:hypothetical protein BG004_008203 [Podila humilis]|nr:hypothetical protein BG004_008203 [Podila humilis]
MDCECAVLGIADSNSRTARLPYTTTSLSNQVPNIKRCSRFTYSKASEKQHELLILSYMNKDLSVNKATKHASLPRSAASRFIRRHLEAKDSELYNIDRATRYWGDCEDYEKFVKHMPYDGWATVAFCKGHSSN